MRVLLTPVGSAGDNLPFIGLGRELARRGHDVAVATYDHFAALAERCGLHFVSTGSDEEYRAATDDPDLFHPVKGYAAVMERVGEYNRRLLEIVSEQEARGDCTVVAHSLDFASRALADKTGMPVVRVHLQPSIVRTSYRVPVMTGSDDYSFLPTWLKRTLWSLVDRAVLDPPVAPVVNELRTRLGLPPVRRIFVNQLHSPLLTLAMFPSWYAPPQPDWPESLEQCDFPLFDAAFDDGLPDEVERFTSDGPPPIVFTPGSAMRYGHTFFAAAIGACERLGRRALLLTRHAEQVPVHLPAGVLRFDFAPLSLLLPHCAALVHHGGIGTTAAGLAAGVPQVVVPFSHDQPDNANRVQRLGVGRRILPSRLDAGRLARALDALLDADGVQRRCAGIAARYGGRPEANGSSEAGRPAGIHRACELIESVSSGRAGGSRSR